MLVYSRQYLTTRLRIYSQYHPVAMDSRLKILFKLLAIPQGDIDLDQLIQYEQINDRFFKESQRLK